MPSLVDDRRQRDLLTALPETMTAIAITRPGDASVLAKVERPVPQPGPGEVLIRVGAAGVNRPDLLQRRGLYPPPAGAPDIPGLEVAGQVVARGAGVEAIALGERVCALVAGGGYAEYCLAAATLCHPVPPNLGISQAAALPEALFTVWSNVFERGRLQPGETLLVQGGCSGIGTIAIQVARQFGARVLATAGSDEKCAACAALGAEPINYRHDDFGQRIMELTNGAGVNLILDIIGGPYLSRHLEILAPGGRLVIIAVQGGHKAEVSLLPILLNHLTITGSTLRPRSLEEKSRLARAIRAELWPWVAAGQVKPMVYARFPIEEAGQAHELMETGRHIGKIVLTTRALEE